MNAKATKAAMAKFEASFSKRYGEATLQRSSEVNPYEVIPTGSMILDHRLTVGGYVEGRIIEIWGPPGVGKSTLSLMGLREAQRKHKDRNVAVIDMERKFDRAWAVAHGVDLERLHVYSPRSAEDVADALKDFCQSGLFSMVVLDSVGAMIPEAEKEKDAGESAMGKYAGIVTRMIKIAAVEAAESETTVILINQVRANLGYGADTTTGGGWALKHGTTMKLKLRRTATPPFKAKIGKEEMQVGHQIAFKVERNGVGPANREGQFNLFVVASKKYGPVGIDSADEAVTLGIETNAIEQAGAWYTLPGGERLQGKEAVVDRLRNDLDLLDAIRTASLATVSGEIVEEEADDVDESGEATQDDRPNFKRGVPDEDQ